MRHFVRLTGLVASLFGIGCGAASTPGPSPETAEAVGGMTAPAPAEPAAGSLNEPTEEGQRVATASGLEYETVRPGDGRQARPGDRVVIHYDAAIEGGEAIDSSRDRGTPWAHTVGDVRAVQGFNEGLAGMRVGELRRLIVPANLAYGALGTFGEYAPGRERNLDGAMQAEELPSIPPNSTILYEVELLEIEPDPADEAGEAVETPPEEQGEGTAPTG